MWFFILFVAAIAGGLGCGFWFETRPQAKRRHCELDLARMRVELSHAEEKLARLSEKSPSDQSSGARRNCELEVARMRVEIAHEEENLAHHIEREKRASLPEDPEARIVQKRRELAELEDSVQDRRTAAT